MALGFVSVMYDKEYTFNDMVKKVLVMMLKKRSHESVALRTVTIVCS